MSYQVYEEYYKQGMVGSASVPRVALALYERIQRQLKQAIACCGDPTALRRQLQPAHAMVVHLASLYMHSDDQAYQALAIGHDRLASQLAELFRQSRLQPDLPEQLSQALARVQAYEEAWRQQLQIKRRFSDRTPSAGLNVRRKDGN